MNRLRTPRWLAWWFTAGFLASGSTSALSQRPVITTLCAIVAAPQRFNGRLVEFTAQYVSDGIEHSVLLDGARCKQGISPEFPNKLKGEEELTRAVFIDHPGTMDKVISAT